ncbi:flagellar basal-body MS-ring/collar protein FliF [Algiphilus sp.]|uniref:flagellar basal-body MS-ring/collar protein FliF n=1 Tax=Algiphilus sp. TaxID=1872431 RepID=UPI0032EF11EC
MARTPIGVIQEVPALKPILLLVGLALAVALGISIYMWSRGTDWAPVTSGLDATESAQIAQSLEAAGIPTQVSDMGNAVLVPRTQLHAARLQLASTDAIGSDAGFEMLSESPGFGVSQFMESARYQYALETELARTISSLAPVRSARVHLAVARESAFVRDSSRASASVVVDLHAGRRLSTDQARSIVNLLAASVPQMDPSAVTVVDSAGNLLSERANQDSPESQARRHFEMARQTEALLTSRIVGLLEAVVGEGRVRAQVTVEQQTESRELASERVQGDPVAVTSERIKEEREARQAAGAAGAAANMPDNPDGQAATNNEEQSLQSSDIQRNYAVGREYEFARQPPGSIKRVSAAILVDNLPETDAEGNAISRPLDPEKLERLRRLAESAIGFDAARGDQLTIDNARFVEAGPALGAPEETALWERLIDDGWLQMAARNFGGVLLLLVLIFTVLRPLMRTLMEPITVQALDDPEMRPQLAGAVAGDVESGAASMNAAPEHEVREAPYERQLKAARDVVQQDPKRVAQLMRTWVGNDG